MVALGGTLVIDGREVQITQAVCRLFVGRLDVDFSSERISGGCVNIPVGDTVEFAALSNRTVSIADCPNADYENLLFKPAFAFKHEYYSVRSLKVDSIGFNQNDNVLCLAIHLTASDDESDTELLVEGTLKAECQQVDRLRLLLASCPIPVRFANHYLPLLGIPTIPADATRAQLISLFGAPNAEGGGPHPQFGDIPVWIRYTLPNCFLHFQFDSETARQITLGPREEWLEQQGLGSLKELYCSPWVR